jgi:hypothetical protein
MRNLLWILFIVSCGQVVKIETGDPQALCQARTCTNVNGTITVSKEDQNNCQIISHEMAKFEAYETKGYPDSFFMTEPKGCL